MDLELIKEIEEFQAINLKEFNGYSEEIIESLKLYNNSISYVKYKSEDMALICLKKAIKANEGFLEAHNLLALLYVNKGEYPNAVECINKVLNADGENQKAIKYINYIREKNSENETELKSSAQNNKTNQSKNKSKNKNEIKSKNKDENQNESKNENNNLNKNTQSKKINIFEKYNAINKKRNRILTIAYSFLAVALVLISFAAMTYFVNHNKKNPNGIVKKEKTQTQINNVTPNPSSSNVEASLNDEYDKPVKEKKKKKVKVETKPVLEKPIDTANKYLTANNFDMSADELRKLDKTKLTVQEKQQYQQVAEKIYSATGQQNYQKGRDLYQASKYKEAIPYLERYALAEKKDDYRGWVLYYLAKAYYNTSNKQKASEYIDKLKSEYPNSIMVTNASSWYK